MTKVKTVVFEDEEALQSIAELSQTTEEKNQPSEEDIDSLFNSMPIQVEEVPYKVSVVEVIPLRDFRCSFAGVQYVFSKNKRQMVPIALRDFLLKNKQSPKIKDIY